LDGLGEDVGGQGAVAGGGGGGGQLEGAGGTDGSGVSTIIGSAASAAASSVAAASAALPFPNAVGASISKTTVELASKLHDRLSMGKGDHHRKRGSTWSSGTCATMSPPPSRTCCCALACFQLAFPLARLHPGSPPSLLTSPTCHFVQPCCGVP
jgi:hypothetical protein